MITAEPFGLTFSLHDSKQELAIERVASEHEIKRIRVGKRAYITLLNFRFSEPLQTDVRYFYDIHFSNGRDPAFNLAQCMPDIVYPGSITPSFVITTQVRQILHGSCRRPHHPSVDGLLEVDNLIQAGIEDHSCHPDLLIMTGDQVYMDDVAGPMLNAIHQVIEQLGLFHEGLQVDGINNSEQLQTHELGYYRRQRLLPDIAGNETVLSYFFKGKKKPVFTSVNANNHLISLAEMIAMYCLVWSPELWKTIKISDQYVPAEFKPQFAEEQQIIESFSEGLAKVRRAMAHIPVYMIFDDHDVTDDWNLNRAWEEAVYTNPFAKRIVGNALISYWLCQGWGNNVSNFNALERDVANHFQSQGVVEHDQLIDKLLHWHHWFFKLNTEPKIVVLDTRTQRWRSESSLQKPSGLMDWESLCDLQQELINQPSVIMVSAAPVFGVKLIETIQKIFTFFGQALTVDAENWMAHRGTASVMLNIFRHIKTPPNFVILSGDVHYSFVYDIRLRFRKNSPRITQVTCSGIKNEFPDRLLRWLDRINRILYGPKSLLNWFTQRRNMEIKHRRPDNQSFRTLHNGAGVGLLKVDKDCQHVDASIISKDGHTTHFNTPKD